jgi:hypothetical protein
VDGELPVKRPPASRDHHQQLHMLRTTSLL